jgi:hypothetical protein
MAVAFLTVRVKSPDEDDWGKLHWVLKYLNGTMYLELRLTVESMGTLKWYVDGLHNMHWYTKEPCSQWEREQPRATRGR